MQNVEFVFITTLRLNSCVSAKGLFQNTCPKIFLLAYWDSVENIPIDGMFSGAVDNLETFKISSIDDASFIKIMNELITASRSKNITIICGQNQYGRCKDYLNTNNFTWTFWLDRE